MTKDKRRREAKYWLSQFEKRLDATNQFQGISDKLNSYKALEKTVENYLLFLQGDYSVPSSVLFDLTESDFEKDMPS